MLLVSGMKLVMTGPCWSLRTLKSAESESPKVSEAMRLMLFSLSSPDAPCRVMVAVKVPSVSIVASVGSAWLLRMIVMLSRLVSETVPWKMICSSSVMKGGLLRSMSGLTILVISSVGMMVSTSMAPERVNVLLTRSIVVMDTDF